MANGQIDGPGTCAIATGRASTTLVISAARQRVGLQSSASRAARSSSPSGSSASCSHSGWRLLTEGSAANCASGGGEDCDHSSVSANQGLSPAGSPFLRLRMTSMTKTSTPSAKPNAPIVDSRLGKSQPRPAGYVYTRRGIPSRPLTCIGKNASWKKTNISQKLRRPRPSLGMRPVIFGSQYRSPAKSGKTAPPTIT